MDFANKTVDELEARQNEIAAEIDGLNSVEEINARSAEFDAIKTELEARKAAAKKKAEIRDAVAHGAGKTIEKMEERKVEIETRNTKAYIDAFAKYIKTNDDTECRALLTTNATDASASITGYVPVPDLVQDVVKTAWERTELMNLVRKTNLKGNVKVGFELTATGAVVHKEGTTNPDEEQITLGIVTMVPASIKKWITVSDEAIDLTGEAFVRYIYDEITHRIAVKAEEILVSQIAALPTTATASSVSAANVAGAPAIGLIAEAIGHVHGNNLAIAMNRGTWAAFKQAQYDGNFNVDPFEGLRVYFTDALPAYSAADEEDVYAIVGDFYAGAQANFPNGNEISIKVDNLSLAEKDLVKFVGRQYVGIGIVGDKAFALISKPENP